MIKAVIFDIGGVLRNNIDVKRFWKSSKGSKRLREDFGTGKLSIKEFISKGSKLLNLSEEEFFKEYKKAYDNTRLNKKVFNIYKKIRLNKYLLSDTNPLHTNFEKKKYKKIAAKKIFLSHNIGMRKNKVETFKFIIKKAKLNPEEVIMIDDEPKNLDNAKKLGMCTILFKNAKQLKKDLKKFGINI